MIPWIFIDGPGTGTVVGDADTPITWPDGWDHDTPWSSGEIINGRSEKLFEKRIPPKRDKRRGKRYNKNND
jgi:hypothetical protein